MLFCRIILELLILLCSGLGPGLALVRRRRCNPVEKLCLAIGLSWVLVYLAGTGIYLLHLNLKWHFAVSGIGLVLLLCCAGDLKKLWGQRQVRRAVGGFALLLVWNILILSVARHYSGGAWSGDWWEHYQRTNFFLEYLPRDSVFLDIYNLPARPPMMNILCAHFLAQTGNRFELYQTASAILNLLIYFPCVLLLGALARRGRRQWMLLVIFFAASPVVVENVTFSWTKLFCGFYILLGTWLYLRGWQKQDSFRITAAFAALCAGMLVHYSGGPYLVFFALHYALVWKDRRSKWREPLVTAIVCAALLASWFAWSIAFYGLKTTASSNTAVADSQHLSFQGNLGKIGGNILATFIPHPLHISRHEFDRLYVQPNALGHLRDYWFLIYQTTLPMAMGMAGGLIVVFLMIRNLVFGGPRIDGPGGGARRLRIFWGSFAGFCALVGIAVHGTPDAYGVAHICLLPLAALGITFLAASWPSLPGRLRFAAAGFVVVDFCLGVFLQMHIQRLNFEIRTIGSVQLLPLNDQLLGVRSVLNDLVKRDDGVSFLGDYCRNWTGMLEILIVVIFAAMLHPLALACGGANRSRRNPKPLFFALILLLAAGTVYCAMDELDGSASRAVQLDEAPLAQLQQAVGQARQIAAAAPESSAAQLALGEALYRSGDVNGALDQLMMAYALDNSNPAARYDALLLVNAGTAVDAEDSRRYLFAESAYDYPDSAPDQIQLGYLLLAEHHPQAAMAPLAAAVQINPQSPDALALLGIANGQIGDADHLRQAIDLLTQALRLRPDSGQISDALRQYLKLAGGSDADVDAYLQRARGGS
jgi:tetratricopeptide (TPR) repeat protein